MDELSRQIKQLQKHDQQRPAPKSYIAALTQPENVELQRFSQMRSWPGQPHCQIDQMQRQINRLASELRRYQNPRRLKVIQYAVFASASGTLGAIITSVVETHVCLPLREMVLLVLSFQVESTPGSSTLR